MVAAADSVECSCTRRLTGRVCWEGSRPLPGANTYYPKEEPGVGKTFSRLTTGVPFSVIDHLVDEFGPDLQRKLTRKRKQAEP